MAAAMLVAVGILAFAGTANAAATLTMSPGPYTNSHAITVSGSGFSLRKSGNTIEILMCSDPGGTTTNLPRDNSSCDGTTVSPNTIVPTATGTFTDTYTILHLSPKLGFAITCDATHYCVLWVGEDYVNTFLGSTARPTAFSRPFLVGAPAGALPSSGGSTSGGSTGVIVGVLVVAVAVGGFVGAAFWRRRRHGSPAG